MGSFVKIEGDLGGAHASHTQTEESKINIIDVSWADSELAENISTRSVIIMFLGYFLTRNTMSMVPNQLGAFLKYLLTKRTLDVSSSV